MTPGRWVATASALFAALLMFGVVAIYAYGRAQPERVEVAVRAELGSPPGEVWALLSDPARRPEWRPHIDRIGRIADDAEGHEVWRELDPSGDRFDFAVIERQPPRRVVLEVASVDQIGMEGRWTWVVEGDPEGPGSVVLLTEQTAIANPLWRGLNRLSRDPFLTVETEMGLLAAHLGVPADLDRLR